ncbi:hypothetical protein E2562_025449 [Oryza meyeriana var. granulata]|uniref:Clp R domain-containing protein n=1 Tax=Oryza meyeriana var. granulata TaxID=110450 RepID=A0A6G1D7U0_9ORYZ|nr:hypothetical protein E2562_025449 [Oryza meyeriana var. granulata]
MTRGERSNIYTRRDQNDLCFAVSLDRLPSVFASSSSSTDEPPVSNSLTVAIKHSQANQCRNPDTFHFYHQVATAQTPTVVKVELLQLVLAILDDPIISHVFSEAGFRSGDIKLAILRPTPPMPLLGRGLPTRSRSPPLFLCSFATANNADVPSPARNLVDAGEENCHRIAEILSRGHNPMLVGVGAASVANDFAAASPYHIIHVEPNSINKLDLGVMATMASTTSETVGRQSDTDSPLGRAAGGPLAGAGGLLPVLAGSCEEREDNARGILVSSYANIASLFHCQAKNTKIIDAVSTG